MRDDVRWLLTTDNGETARQTELLADGWEPFAVVVHPDNARLGEWTEVWYRRLVEREGGSDDR